MQRFIKQGGIMLSRFTIAFFVLCHLIFCGLSAAELTSDRAYFGGGLSCYAAGDTIMYVYFEAEHAPLMEPGMVKFCSARMPAIPGMSTQLQPVLETGFGQPLLCLMTG
jgi:hypothetical protein